MKKIAITTLGCKINQFESAAMADSLAKEGYELVPFEPGADVYVINTCTVTARTDSESRRLIRRAQRWNPSGRVLVTGCYAQVAAETVASLPGVDFVFGNAEKKDIASLIPLLGGEEKVLVSDISKEEQAGTMAVETFSEHTRAFLQVQTGCDARCSYCIVPIARGRSRSVPYDEALRAVADLTSREYREVVLTGIHLGSYGKDHSPETNLLNLLKDIEERRLSGRIRLGSLEPTEIDDDLISFLACSQTICHHLHIPLQSGSDTVLARMNRHYAGQFFRELLEKIAKSIPEVCIGADVIVGFPGESDGEFEATRRLIQDLPISYLHVFPFSARPGTPAATMEAQVPPAVIHTRGEILRMLSEEKKSEYYGSFLGKELDVLVEGHGKGANVGMKGLSRNYIPVYIQQAAGLQNKEVLVRGGCTYRDGILGEVIKGRLL